jgi:hypothetical protein
VPTMVIYRLECEHLVLGVPNLQTLHCAMCDWEERHTVGIVIKEWHAYCVNTDCRFGRWTGLSEALARQLQLKHASKHQGHKAVHRAEIRKESLRVRDRMAANGFFTETEAEAQEEAEAG